MRCIKCGNARAGRSRRRTPWDWLLAAAGVYPYRCGACQTRFHARAGWDREPTPAPDAIEHVEPVIQADEQPEAHHAHRVRRRKRKSLLSKLKELREIRKEKKTRIATQIMVYGLALLAFMAIVYLLMQSGVF